MRLTWRGSMLDGGGRFEIPVGIVILIDEAGRAVELGPVRPRRPDGDAGAIRRAERRARGDFGDRPPERWYAEFLRDYAAHDIDRVLELYAEDVLMVDHRAVGWDPVHGRDELRKLYESVFAASPGIRVEVEEVLACDERVIATHIAFRGEGRLAGEFEDPMSHVTVVEGGRCVRVDIYDYHDDVAILRRYHELGGYPAALGHRPAERFFAEFKRRFDAHDVEGLMELMDDNRVLIDHRRLGWEASEGLDETRAASRRRVLGIARHLFRNRRGARMR